MRLRKVKNAKITLASHPNHVVIDPMNHYGAWQKLFSNHHPIHLEIGCGKGQFITSMAKKYPDINFIAIEKYDSVLLRVLEKLLKEPLQNLLLVHIDAEQLDKLFSKGEIETIYLNFSDPWPKKRQEKRRLTHPNFLEKYRSVLQPEGIIQLKTDNDLLFEYSMMKFNHEPDFLIQRISLDWNRECVHNVSTEFEVKFIEQGKPIFYIEVKLERTDR